jgi:hypothetical protein
MRLIASISALAVTVALTAFAACTHSASAPLGAVGGDRALDWGPAPAVFPAGAQLAVLAGDPSRPGPFTLRLRFPDGYRIPPYTVGSDEHITVVQGTFLVGMGERFGEEALTPLVRGAFATAPAGRPHYAATRGTTEVQVQGEGPFTIRYVHAADLPLSARISSR